MYAPALEDSSDMQVVEQVKNIAFMMIDKIIGHIEKIRTQNRGVE